MKDIYKGRCSVGNVDRSPRQLFLEKQNIRKSRNEDENIKKKVFETFNQLLQFREIAFNVFKSKFFQ